MSFFFNHGFSLSQETRDYLLFLSSYHSGEIHVLLTKVFKFSCSLDESWEWIHGLQWIHGGKRLAFLNLQGTSPNSGAFKYESVSRLRQRHAVIALCRKRQSIFQIFSCLLSTREEWLTWIFPSVLLIRFPKQLWVFLQVPFRSFPHSRPGEWLTNLGSLFQF